MDIATKVFAKIRAMYEKGETQEEIAKKFGISQPYLNQLLSGQRKASGISLDVIEKMFPNATINLEGNINNHDGIVASNLQSTKINADKNFLCPQTGFDNQSQSQTIQKILEDNTLTNKEKIKFIAVIIAKPQNNK